MSTLSQAPSLGSKYEAYVERRISTARARIRLLDLAVVGLIFVGGTLAYALAMALSDRFFELPSLVRQLAFCSYAVVALAGIGWVVTQIFLRRINPYYAAQQVEHGLPGAKNSLVNWLDLRERDLPPAIKNAVSQRAAKELSRADFDQLLGTRQAAWIGVITGVLFLGILVLFFLSPPQFFSLMRRTFAPFTESTIATRTQLTLVQPEGGNLTVGVGRAVTFAVLVDGRVPEVGRPDSVRLRYRHHENDPFIDRPLDYNEATRQWGAVLPATEVRNGFWYIAAAGDAETSQYRVDVRSTPLLTDYLVRYHYRPYLNRPDHTSTDPNIEALQGAEVALLARTNRSVRDGQLELDPVQKPGEKEPTKIIIPAEIVAEDPQALRFRFVLQTDGAYRIWFTSQEGERNTDPVPHTIHVRRDEAPHVVLTKPGRPVSLPANGTLALQGAVRDDYGLTRLELKMNIQGEEQSKPYRPGKSFRFDNGSFPLKLDYKDLVELDKIRLRNGQSLQPGMTIEYWLEAADNCDFTQPNIGKSERYKVTIVPHQKDPQDQKQQQNDRQQAKNEQQQHEKKQDEQLEQENQKQQSQENKDAQSQESNQNQQQSDNAQGQPEGQESQEKNLENQKEKLEQAINEQEKQDQQSEDKDPKDQQNDGQKSGTDSKDQQSGDPKGEAGKDQKDQKSGDPKGEAGKDQQKDQKPGDPKGEAGKDQQKDQKSGDPKGETGKDQSKDQKPGDPKGEAGKDQQNDQKPGDPKGEAGKDQQKDQKSGDPKGETGKDQQKDQKSGDPKGEAGKDQKPGDPKGEAGKDEQKDQKDQKPGDPKGEAGKDQQKDQKPGDPKGGKDQQKDQKSGDPKGEAGKDQPKDQKPGDPKGEAGKDQQKDQKPGDPKGEAGKDQQKDQKSGDPKGEAGKDLQKDQKSGDPKGEAGKDQQKDQKPGDQKGEAGKGRDSRESTGENNDQKPENNDGVRSNAPGTAAKGVPPGRAVDDPNATPHGDEPGSKRPRAGELQLEDIRKKVTKDVLKKANMTEQEFQEFLRAYEAMLKRKQALDPGAEKLTDPKARGGNLKNIGAKRMQPTGKDDKATRGALALPPPEFRDAYKEFTEKISEQGRPTEKK
jgi:hypothetical protein